jgi:hypothetical protein
MKVKLNIFRTGTRKQFGVMGVKKTPFVTTTSAQSGLGCRIVPGWNVRRGLSQSLNFS